MRQRAAARPGARSSAAGSPARRRARLRDVTAASFQRWRDLHPKSPKTHNEYLAAASGFMRWLVKGGLLLKNPLDVEVVGRVDGRGKQTFERPAFTQEEFQRLLLVAGAHRVLYLVAATTTLRRGALYELLWSDVHLDAPVPCIDVRAATQKDRKNRRVYLTEDAVSELHGLQKIRTGTKPRVFAGLLPKDGLEWFKADLAKAGIPFEDSLGRRADFHALRHTGCTWGGATGVAGPTFQAFTGHATPSQAARYTHAEHLPVLDLVQRLPRFDLPPLDVPREVVGGGTLLGTLENVFERQDRSRLGVKGLSRNNQNMARNKGKRRPLSQLVASGLDVSLNAGDRNRTCTGCPTGT